MKHFLAISVFAFTSYCSTIYDFSPIETTSTWNYNYYRNFNASGNYFWMAYKESLNIDLQIINKVYNKESTYALVQVHEQGIYTNNNTDSIVNNIYIDTAIIINDSVKALNWKCKVFPFYETRCVDSTLTQTCLAGIDYTRFITQGNYPYSKTYIQNVGLYSLNKFYYPHAMPDSTIITLIRYNNKNIYPIRTSHLSNNKSLKSTNKKTKFGISNGAFLNQSVFQLNGRKSTTNNCAKSMLFRTKY